MEFLHNQFLGRILCVFMSEHLTEETQRLHAHDQI
jgi:hypothetical protein